jgi:hypothetical protein
MTAVSLKHYYGKTVIITDAGGTSVSGKVTDYVYPEDNENGSESIILDLREGPAREFYPEDISVIKLA